MKFLLYGANGYTGKLITAACKDHKLYPTLAGRNKDDITELANKLDYPFEIVDLSQSKQLDRILSDYEVVLNVAGPFIYTAQPLVEACLRTHTHYVDITGEIEVFEKIHSYHETALKKGLMLLPGAGFDVVPTDCMAAYLHQRMPDANTLRLAFSTAEGGFSSGSLITMIEHLHKGGAIRQDGKLTSVPIGHHTTWLPFTNEKNHFALSIPWGDIATAYFTTGIPNIETFMGFPPRLYQVVKYSQYAKGLLKIGAIKRLLQQWAKKQVAGPTTTQHQQAKSYVWGEVKNKAGNVKSARLVTPEAYQLTALSSLLIIQKILSGQVFPGFQTPAGAYGANLILEISGCSRADL